MGTMYHSLFRKGDEVMKAKFSAVIKKALKSVAVASSETTSIFSLYQPKTPKALVKSEKK